MAIEAQKDICSIAHIRIPSWNKRLRVEVWALLQRCPLQQLWSAHMLDWLILVDRSPIQKLLVTHPFIVIIWPSLKTVEKWWNKEDHSHSAIFRRQNVTKTFNNNETKQSSGAVSLWKMKQFHCLQCWAEATLYSFDMLIMSEIPLGPYYISYLTNNIFKTNKSCLMQLNV